MLKIIQVKSAIRRKQDQKDTLRALGLRRPGQTVYHEDSQVIRGMIQKIYYMLEVSEVTSKQADVEQEAPDAAPVAKVKSAAEAEAEKPAEPPAAEAPAQQPEPEAAEQPEQVTETAEEPAEDEDETEAENKE